VSTSLPDLPFLSAGPKKLLIDGEWVKPSSGGVIDSINPSTGEVVAQIAEGDATDVDRAVAAARRAFEGPWRSVTPAARQAYLWALADAIAAKYSELRRLASIDMGVPIGPDPALGAEKSADLLRYFAGWATKIHGHTLPNSVPSMVTYTRREPVGVVAAITPWNSPINQVLWKLGPVLATGCTMVIKPAEQASLVTLRIGELIAELNLPDGVVNIVTGYGPTVGSALAEHPGVDKVAFTGSTAVGQSIVRSAAGNLKRLTLELGGKSPDIIFADADFAQAAPAAAMGVFSNSGQSCSAGSRIFVERPIYDDFLAAAADVAASLKVGNSLDPQTQIGPLVTQEHLGRVTEYLAIGQREGARTVIGGNRLQDGGLARGYFVEPTVLADVNDDMRIVREEIFGPVGCVLSFDTIEEVAARANATNYGLAGGVWTRDIGKAHWLAARLKAGSVWVNTYNQFDPAVPFGGYRMSGWGRECGPESLDAYLNTKAVWIRTE
jgi:aldehyde dehydrogenase (NAD+)